MPMHSGARVIPSIEQLRQRARVQALEGEYGRDAVVSALRAEAEALRARLTSGASAAAVANGDDAAAIIEAGLEAQLKRGFAGSLRAVINATGVIVHTNLGRAPLANAAAARVAELVTTYSNLEYDLTRGERGSRSVHAERLLRGLTGADAAVVVNNNAAATLLILAALAHGREVIISRGEMVEIGGGFRVPDVMKQSGAVLREVGTTNKTRAADYAAAISERTGLILRVHPSNFRIEGFTARPSLEELVALGRRFNVAVAEDLGSGNLLPAVPEPTVQASIGTGADIVCFSGDKLLGGPQAGIIVGRKDAVDRVRTHPLMRALRVDKMTYAALEATLLEYRGGRAERQVPVARMVSIGIDEIEQRARRLADAINASRGGLRAEIVDGVSTIGGGSAPGSALPTRLVALTAAGTGADALEERFRQLDPPVIARIENDRVVLDLRTVLEQQDAVLENLLTRL
jgi:L-seryl-tRNA(Ser) seleniumtransferase